MERAREEYQGYSFDQADLRDKIRSSGTKDTADDSTVQRLHSPPNDSLPTPMDTDSGCKVGDLRDLITGIPAPSKRELFTQPKLTEVQPLFQSSDVRWKDSKEVAL